MSTAILRPRGVVGPIEAMGLRDSFTRVLNNGASSVIVDLTGVQQLSAAGLAAVTNLLGQGRRSGIPVRVLPPEEGSEAALIIELADLRRFLAPGGLWNVQQNEDRPAAPAFASDRSLHHRVLRRFRRSGREKACSETPADWAESDTDARERVS